jgi:hypothetical protein
MEGRRGRAESWVLDDWSDGGVCSGDSRDNCGDFSVDECVDECRVFLKVFGKVGLYDMWLFNSVLALVLAVYAFVV